MSDIRKNMKKISDYQKILRLAYGENVPESLLRLNRELQILHADLFIEYNEKLFSLIRKDVFTLGVGCIDSFEGSFGYLWGMNKEFAQKTEEELDYEIDWNPTRNSIFDKTNDLVKKYQHLLLDLKEE